MVKEIAKLIVKEASARRGSVGAEHGDGLVCVTEVEFHPFKG